MKQPKDNKLVVHIDASDLPILREEGKELVFKRSAEDAIEKLLKLDMQVKFAIDYVKREIEKAGLALNPDFKSVQGDKIKVGYRFFGAKYYIDNDKLDKLPKELVTVEVIKKHKLASASEIEKYIKEHDGKLPEGLVEAERQKQITMKPIHEFGDDES